MKHGWFIRADRPAARDRRCDDVRWPCSSRSAIGYGLSWRRLGPSVGLWLARFALAAFVVAAVTDFFDGWLARRWRAVSLMGAILDPIADKILVCGAILGLLAVGTPGVLIPGALILFREFAVSAMREVLAPRGIKLPVTFLAKIKTTLQLVALAAVMFIWFWPVWRIDAPIAPLIKAMQGAEMLLALAAVVTVWTGVEYARAAWRALKAQSAGSGMNSSWSCGGSVKRPACQSALACSMRSLDEETKFHQMCRSPIGSPPSSMIVAGSTPVNSTGWPGVKTSIWPARQDWPSTSTWPAAT